MNLLVVDDKSALREVMARRLRDAGHEVAEAASAEEALELLAKGAFDLMVSDLKMPGLDGLQLLEKARALDGGLAVIMVSGHAVVEDAVRAMRLGAADFLIKPFPMEELELKVAKALGQRRLEARGLMLEEDLARARGAMLGSSPAMRAVFDDIRKLAAARATVLVLGESGSGKELVARAIHDSGPWKAEPFAALHCAALAPGVLESELFGHEKGAFTGAAARKAGRFELAGAGTLFLDEVSEIPLETQVKLLRVLQERQFERVGGSRTLPLRARLIAASNRDLAESVKAGRFREDLYYRLAVVSLRLPPLRERKGDIPELAEAFLRRYATEQGKAVRGFKAGSLEALQAHDWPGNVRELQNLIERAVVFCEGGELEIAPLAPVAGGAASLHGGLDGALRAVETKLIEEALRQSGGVQAQAAKLLGVSRSALQYKLQKLGFKEDA